MGKQRSGHTALGVHRRRLGDRPEPQAARLFVKAIDSPALTGLIEDSAPARSSR
jgi:hypothetical protein